MDAPFRNRRRRSPSQLGQESSASNLSDSKDLDSANGLDSGKDEGEEEDEEEEDDKDDEEVEYLAPDYPQEESREDSDAYVPWSP